MKNCVNCRRKLDNESSVQCEKCKINETKYGKPSSCKYCQLPAAFVDRLCVHCSYSRRKMGSPVNCSKCALRCAFTKDDKRATTVLCRMCSINMAPEDKMKHKRAAKTSSKAEKLKRPRLSSPLVSKQASTSDSQLHQLKDQIFELKSTIMQRDQTIIEKDKTISLIKTELMLKEKEHLESLKTIHKRNESMVGNLKEQVRELTKQLDYSNSKSRIR